MKLKDMKEKHDHKFTDLLKVGIFALLMIAPLFASVSQMLYATINKNAHESYYGETINQKEYININNKNDLQVNKIYQFNNQNNLDISSILVGDSDHGIYVTNLHVEYTTLTTQFDENEVYFMAFYNPANQNLLYTMLKDENLNQILYFTSSGTSFIATFEYLGNNLLNNYMFDYTDCIQSIEYNKYSYLDNAFYYGVDQMTKSDLFNWTQNTAIYTGVKAMTDNLQIQTPAIAILIVYWFILTIIYIIIDIVIKCFTAITHLI